MTKEELIKNKRELESEEKELTRQAGVIASKIHDMHDEMRKMYKEYVSEHLPFKVGDELVYSFINNEGDLINRDITITEINTYNCLLTQIILYYEYTPKRGDDVKEIPAKKFGRIDSVRIDGTVGGFRNEILTKKYNNEQ